MNERIALFDDEMQAFGFQDIQGDPANVDTTQPITRSCDTEGVELVTDPDLLAANGHPTDGSVFIARAPVGYVSPLDGEGQPVPATITVTADVDLRDGEGMVKQRTFQYEVVWTATTDLAAAIKPLGGPIPRS